MLNDENEDSASGKAAWSALLILSGIAVAFALATFYLAPWIESRDYERKLQTRVDTWDAALQTYRRCLFGGSPEDALTVTKIVGAAANNPEFLDQVKACRNRLGDQMGDPPPPVDRELTPLVESLFDALDNLPPKNLYARHELSNEFFEELCGRFHEAEVSLATIRSSVTDSPSNQIASNCNTAFEDNRPVVPNDLPDTVAASTPAAWKISSDDARLELQYNSKLIDRSYWARTENGHSWDIVIGPPDMPFVAAFARDDDTLWSISEHRIMRHTPRGWDEEFEIDEDLEPVSIHHAPATNTTSVIAWGPEGEQTVLRFEKGKEKATQTITFQEDAGARLLSAAFSPTGEVFGVTMPGETSEKVQFVMSRLGLRNEKPQREKLAIEATSAPSMSPSWCFARDRIWLLIDTVMLTHGIAKGKWRATPSLPRGFEPRFAACRDNAIALLGKMDVAGMPRLDMVSMCRETGCDSPVQVSPFPALRAGLLWDRRELELVFDDGQRWYQLAASNDAPREFDVLSITKSQKGPLDHLMARHGRKFYSLVSVDNLPRAGEPQAVTSFPQTAVVSRTRDVLSP